MSNCPKCGKHNIEGAQYCQNCGSVLLEPIEENKIDINRPKVIAAGILNFIFGAIFLSGPSSLSFILYALTFTYFGSIILPHGPKNADDILKSMGYTGSLGGLFMLIAGIASIFTPTPSYTNPFITIIIGIITGIIIGALSSIPGVFIIYLKNKW